MATCKECFHFEACSGFKPTDLDKDVFHYLQMGCPEEIPDIDKRCDAFKQRTEWVEVVRCKDCKHCDFFYPTKEKDKEPIPAWYCKPWKSSRKPDDFCSCGEKRGDRNE